MHRYEEMETSTTTKDSLEHETKTVSSPLTRITPTTTLNLGTRFLVVGKICNAPEIRYSKTPLMMPRHRRLAINILIKINPTQIHFYSHDQSKSFKVVNQSCPSILNGPKFIIEKKAIF